MRKLHADRRMVHRNIVSELVRMAKDNSLHDIEAFAVAAALHSAKHTLLHFRGEYEVQNKLDGGWDPVTVADRAGETAIRERIEDAFPSHGIIGEEFGEKKGSSSYTWILDPIDGTRAFVAGLPTWTTLIGLYREGVPVLGLMYQPFVDEMFIGHSGTAYSVYRGQHRLLRARQTETLKSARAGTTSPHLFSTKTQAAAHNALQSQAQMLRYGGDAYFFAMVAAGQLDIAIDPKLQIYDIAALIPIIEGSGGHVSCWDGSPAANGGDIVATGSMELMQEMRRLLSGPS